MSASRKIINKLNENTDPLFWENPPDKPTFDEVLEKYANYCATLNSATKREALSQVFWAYIKEIGTPIIENFSEEEVKVYFLYPRENYDHETKKLYLSGDFHGFTSTDNDRQEMHHKLNTDIMYRSNVMPRNSVVTYGFLQVPEKFQNKSRQELIGEVMPKSFYGKEAIPKLGDDPLTDSCDLFLMSSATDTVKISDKNHLYLYKDNEGKIYYKIQGENENQYLRDEKIKNALKDEKFDQLSENPFKYANQKTYIIVLKETSKRGHTLIDFKMSDEHAKHSDVMGPIFCANVDNNLASINLFKNTDWKKLLSEEYPGYLKNLKHTGTYLCDKDNLLRKDENAADMGKIWNNKEDTRSVTVFQSGEDQIENLIIIHDGVGYMGTGTIERIDDLIGEGKIPKNTAIICISQLPGLIEKYKNESPEEFAEATDPRPIEYGSRIDDYIKFIDQALSKLDYSDVPAKNRTLIGSSMSGTASVYMILKHKDKFGHAIAQAPTEGTRIILRPLMQERIKAKELKNEVEDLSGKIHLSCGKFETLEYAQNIRLAHTEELAEILGSHNQALPVDKTGNYGHLPHCWSQELTKTLPNLFPKDELTSTAKVAKSLGIKPSSQILFEEDKHAKKNNDKKMTKDDIACHSTKGKKSAQEFPQKTEKTSVTSTDDFNITYGKRPRK